MAAAVAAGADAASWQPTWATPRGSRVVLAGSRLPRLRLEERLADKPEHELLCSATASDEVGRDGGLVVVPHAQDTAVKELVMEAAEAQPVLHGVRTVEGPATQVAGVESHGLRCRATRRIRISRSWYSYATSTSSRNRGSRRRSCCTHAPAAATSGPSRSRPGSSSSPRCSDSSNFASSSNRAIRATRAGSRRRATSNPGSS